MLRLYKNCPTLDLHGETGDIAEILVKDFIYDNYRLKNSCIIIIHGVGAGIVKKRVHEELKIDKYVKKYKQDNFNPGVTIVELDI